MNKYIKPTFMVASLGVNALAAGSGCAITADDRDLIFDGASNEEIQKYFGREEGCNPWVESFCKFTSVDLGAKKAFLS